MRRYNRFLSSFGTIPATTSKNASQAFIDDGAPTTKCTTVYPQFPLYIRLYTQITEQCAVVAVISVKFQKIMEVHFCLRTAQNFICRSTRSIYSMKFYSCTLNVHESWQWVKHLKRAALRCDVENKSQTWKTRLKNYLTLISI